MSRQMWLIVGVMAAIAIVTGYVVKTKNDTAQQESAINSQLPAEENAANYNVPPSIGASVDAGGHVYTNGGNAVYTVGQANSLPITTAY